MSSEEVADTQNDTEDRVESEDVTIGEEIQEEISTDQELHRDEEVEESFELAEKESSEKNEYTLEKDMQNGQEIEAGDTGIEEGEGTNVENKEVEQIESTEKAEDVKTEGFVEEKEKQVDEAVTVSDEKNEETVPASEEKEEPEKEKEDVEKVEAAVDETVTKKKTSDVDLGDILGNEEREGSFTLIQEDEVEEKGEEQETKETKEEQDLMVLLGVAKKKKKKKKRKEGTREDIESDANTYYSIQLPDTGSMMQIGGDFSAIANLSRPPKLGMLKEGGDDDEEEEEEEEEEVEEEVHFLDKQQRQEYIDFYATLEKEFREEKAKNLYLQGQLVTHYQKKKMFSVVNETKISLDKIKRYEKQLDDFEQLLKKADNQKISVDAEITAMRAKQQIRAAEIESVLKQFHIELNEVAKEFINLPSAKGHEEKVVERYLKRHKIEISNLAKIRLDYIKVRNRVNEVQDRLKAVDNLGSHLRLMDYEQLKLDNRNLRDKFEGRDLELLRIRAKCQNAVQIIAHLREKAAALNTDIENLKERMEVIEHDYEDVRGQLNERKWEREHYRKATFKMKKEAGMLGKPKLINDFCRTMEERKVLAQQLEMLKKSYHLTCDRVDKIRRNLGSRSRMRVIKLMMKSSFSKSTAYEIPSAIPSATSEFTTTTYPSTVTFTFQESELGSISQA